MQEHAYLFHFTAVRQCRVWATSDKTMKFQDQSVAKGAGCSREAYKLKKTECLSISTYFNPHRPRKGKGGGNTHILIYMFLKSIYLYFLI